MPKYPAPTLAHLWHRVSQKRKKKSVFFPTLIDALAELKRNHLPAFQFYKEKEGTKIFISDWQLRQQ